MKNKLILLISVLVGIAAFWLSVLLLQKKQAELLEGYQRVEVVVAAKNLVAGTVLQLDDLRSDFILLNRGSGDVFRADQYKQLVGKRMKYSVDAGNAVQWSHVDMPRTGMGDFSNTIQEGYRAISIPISGSASVSGLIHPNDHIDLFGTFTSPDPSNPLQTITRTVSLGQNVTVLATGTQYEGNMNSAGSQRGYSMITVSVRAENVQEIIFAQQASGQLYAALRNPNDISTFELPVINFDYLLQNVGRSGMHSSLGAETF